MMMNVSHKKKWYSGTTQVHVEPPLIPLIKINNNNKLNKDSFRIKLRKDLKSENLDLY